MIFDEISQLSGIWMNFEEISQFFRDLMFFDEISQISGIF